MKWKTEKEIEEVYKQLKPQLDNKLGERTIDRAALCEECKEFIRSGKENMIIIDEVEDLKKFSSPNLCSITIFRTESGIYVKKTAISIQLSWKRNLYHRDIEHLIIYL